MASGNGNGYGRGGRGAALLQLLSNPVRRPGDSGDQPREGPAQATAPSQPGVLHSSAGAGDHPSQSPVPSYQPAAVLQSTSTTDLPAVPPVNLPRPSGRGALIQQMLAQQPQQLQAQQPVVGATSQPVSAHSSISDTAVAGPSKGLGRAALLSQQGIASGRDAPTSTSMPSGLRSMRELSAALPPESVSGVSKGEMVEEAHPDAPAATEEPTKLQRMLDRLEQERAPVIRKGSMGEKAAFSANYIALRCVNAGVYQYAVSFRPSVDSRGMRFKMMNEHKSVIGETKAFDGAILFLPIQLREQETLLKSVRQSDGQEITIKIQLVKVLPFASCRQLYNVVFRRIMSILKMFQVGRNYFLPSGAVPIPQHRLEVWPGYVTAVDEYEGGVMLLTDVSHRVLRTETVLDVISGIIRNNPRGYQDDINKQLIGCMVLTRYNNKTYRIDDIAWDKNPLSSFASITGENITFVDYYRTAYNKVIQDNQQPLLIHIPKKREVREAPKGKKALEVICLIPELSFMTGLTDDMRQDHRVMKDLATHTRITPAQRRISLRTFCRNVNSVVEAKAELTKWGLELDTDVMELEGRILGQEKIILKNRSSDAGVEADWGRALSRDHVITAVDLVNWMIVATSRDASKALEFVNMYIQCARDMGIRVEKPAVYQLQNDRTETYLREIRQKMSDQVQMVVTIFPTSRDDRYNAIKKLCCVECPVPSQVINARTISQQQKLRSVTQKIALQINCKLGGELWAVKIPTKGLMVCGIDTYHDAGQRKNSVAGFVSSVNATCTRWYSRVCSQSPGEELVHGLQVCFTASLRKYHEINHKLPDRIIIYRDGVGDGQLTTVANFEVVQLMECFKHFGTDYEPNLAVVVVQKRINTRILARKGTGPSAVMDNPPPGSILDHTVTRKDWYDFFLVSQHVRQGTVSPTHYIVVHDTSNWDVDKLQSLSYKMTHLYYNWPGTVRVPAPCQYAHKLAYLVGQNIRKEPSQLLSDRLFFL